MHPSTVDDERFATFVDKYAHTNDRVEVERDRIIPRRRRFRFSFRVKFSLVCFVSFWFFFFFFFAARREKWDKNCSTRMNCNHTIYGFSNWTGIKCESIFIGVQLSWLINSVESGENGMEKCFSTTVGEILDYLFKGWNYFYEDGREYVDPDVQFLRFFFQIISIRQMVSYLFNWSRLKFKSLEQWIYNFLCVKRGFKIGGNF